MALQKNYDGKRFQNFVVIRRDHKKKGRWMFLCKCDCGKEFFVEQGNLNRNISCGCMSYDKIREKLYKHGGIHDRLYRVWYAMKGRCNNPNNDAYEYYGGRGIRVCQEWNDDYGAFRKWAIENGYDKNAPKRNCTLDRKDANGNYCPENCRWVDSYVQSNNRRNVLRLTHNGETHTLAEWGEILGIRRATLYRRVALGWNTERVLTEPLGYDRTAKAKRIKKYEERD